MADIVLKPVPFDGTLGRNFEIYKLNVEQVSRLVNEAPQRLPTFIRFVGFLDVAKLKPLLSELGKRLNALEFWDNDLGWKGLADLQAGLKTMVHVKIFTLLRNGVDDEAAASLADSLSGMRSLEELYLPSNGIDEAGAKALAPGLAACVGSLEALGIRENDLDAAALRHLAPAISSMKSLTFLNLSRNPLGPDAGPVLRDILSSLPKLQHVDLTFCELGDAGVKALAPALANVPTSAAVLLEHNDVTDSDTVAAVSRYAAKASAAAAAGRAPRGRDAGIMMDDAVVVGSRTRMLLRFSAVWQVVDLITDILFIAFLFVNSDSVFDPVKLAIGPFLLLWAIMIALAVFAQGRQSLRLLWSGDNDSVLSYKVYSVFEGLVELLVIYAIRYESQFNPVIDYPMIGASILLLILDFRYITLRRSNIHPPWLFYVISGSIINTLVLSALSRYLAKSLGFQLALVAVAFLTIQPFAWSVCGAVGRGENPFAVRFLGYLYVILSLPLVVPIIAFVRGLMARDWSSQPVYGTGNAYSKGGYGMSKSGDYEMSKY